MGKETRKRTTKRKPAKRKPASKANGKSSKPVAIVISEEDERIQKGDVKIDELDLLKLQKLMHQASSTNKDFVLLQKEANRAKETAQEALGTFEEMIAGIRERYALEGWHDFDLSDGERAGTVLFNEKMWQEMKAKVAKK